ncbi:hypothetical protein Lal_00029646 [Lupinus albus]|nr:hypothetical protein Lal_00029646 [Lupinus albus]
MGKDPKVGGSGVDSNKPSNANTRQGKGDVFPYLRGVDLPYVVLDSLHGVDLPYVVLNSLCGIDLPFVVLNSLHGVDLPYVVLNSLRGVDFPPVVLISLCGIDLPCVDIVQLNTSRFPDRLIWQGTNDRTLSLRADFQCLRPAAEVNSWCKRLWSYAIPPSKSFTIWRLYHHKMPTDDNCKRELWEWLSRIFDFHIDLTSIESIFLGCNGKWSPQVHGVLEAAIIHTINTVWYCRNLWRFENKKISLMQAQLRIKLATSLSGNHSKLITNNSVDNFVILREFKVRQNFQKAPRIREVIWLAPIVGWIKINSDGAAHGAPGLAGGGCIFRD